MKYISTIPINSIKKLNKKIFLKRPFPLNKDSELKFSCSMDWCFIPKPFLENIANNVAKEMMLRPPNWISIIKTMCPFCVKYVAVSTTINPVTQQALIDVNSASKKGIIWTSLVISGIISKPAPTAMSNMKERISSLGGFTFKKDSLGLALPSPIPTKTKK